MEKSNGHSKYSIIHISIPLSKTTTYCQVALNRKEEKKNEPISIDDKIRIWVPIERMWYCRCIGIDRLASDHQHLMHRGIDF